MGEVLAAGGGSSRSHWSDDTEVPACSSCQNWGSISINHSGWGTVPVWKGGYVAEGPCLLRSFSFPGRGLLGASARKCLGCVSLHYCCVTWGSLYVQWWCSVNHSAYMAADQSHPHCQNGVSQVWPCVPAHPVQSNVFLRNSSRCGIWFASILKIFASVFIRDTVL